MRLRLPAPSHPLHLVIGQTVWLLWFGVVYGLLSVGCHVEGTPGAPGWSHPLKPALLACTVVVAAVLSAGAWRSWKAAAAPADDADGRSWRFVEKASAWLYASAAFATLWVGLPALLLPACV